MGGSLTLKSAVGIGTTATVSLTRALEDELADAVEVTE
jgi:signal transduction histidine kinase